MSNKYPENFSIKNILGTDENSIHHSLIRFVCACKKSFSILTKRE